MSSSDNASIPHVQDYYARFPEETRLEQGAFRLEFERTKEILGRVLPRPPAIVVDVGGAAGACSFWLADQGYDVHLVDGSERLVAMARARNAGAMRRLASIDVGDARVLPQHDCSAHAVLVMGPLYHLPDDSDRAAALREAHRVLRDGGMVVTAAISRYASALDGLVRYRILDPKFRSIRNRDLRDGQHRNDTDNLEWFTTAYFHRPEDLRREMTVAGFDDVQVLGVEGPAWMLPDFDVRWADAASRADLLDLARRVEREPSLVGVSAHLVGIGRCAAFSG